MPRCRILLDVPRSGQWNMALDEVLLDRAATERRAHLRIYSWSEPTLSLGFFQAIDRREAHGPSIHCPLVRRPSGGGAILHDREITYALAVPGAWHPSQRRELYSRVHQSLAELLVGLGAAATVYAGAALGETASEPFLCFQRRTAGDVVIGGCKVIGSAQRRGKGSLLQHGSILLGRSEFAPELPGIDDLAPLRLGREECVRRTLHGILRAIDSEPDYEALTLEELADCGKLVERKHARAERRERR
jgi:lipoate-protein ligase A